MFYFIDYEFYVSWWASFNEEQYEYLNGCDFDTFDSTLKLQEDFNDVFKYLYYKKYNKKFDEFTWYLENNANDFFKEIEDKYWHNKIDLYELYHDQDFIHFLKELYVVEAFKQIQDSVVDEIKYQLDLDDLDDDLYDLIISFSCRDIPNFEREIRD